MYLIDLFILYIESDSLYTVLVWRCAVSGVVQMYWDLVNYMRSYRSSRNRSSFSPFRLSVGPESLCQRLSPPAIHYAMMKTIGTCTHPHKGDTHRAHTNTDTLHPAQSHQMLLLLMDIIFDDDDIAARIGI